MKVIPAVELEHVGTILFEPTASNSKVDPLPVDPRSIVHMLRQAEVEPFEPSKPFLAAELLAKRLATRNL